MCGIALYNVMEKKYILLVPVYISCELASKSLGYVKLQIYVFQFGIHNSADVKLYAFWLMYDVPIVVVKLVPSCSHSIFVL
jgi:hypothetical protein